MMLGAPQVASPALCHMARPLRGVLRLLVLSAETMCGDARSMRGQLPLGNSLFWLSTGPLKKSDFFLVGEKKKSINPFQGLGHRGNQVQNVQVWADTFF